MIEQITPILSAIGASGVIMYLVKYLLNRRANIKKANADAEQAEANAETININNAGAIMNLIEDHVNTRTKGFKEESERLLQQNITLNGRVEELLKEYTKKMQDLKCSIGKLQKKVDDQNCIINKMRSVSKFYCDREDCKDRQPPGGFNFDKYINGI